MRVKHRRARESLAAKFRPVVREAALFTMRNLFALKLCEILMSLRVKKCERIARFSFVLMQNHVPFREIAALFEHRNRQIAVLDGAARRRRARRKTALFQ